MRVNGEMIRPTGLVCSLMSTTPDMKENGLKTFSMVLASKLGIKAQLNMQGSSTKAGSMGEEDSNGMMEAITRATSRTDNLKDLESTILPTWRRPTKESSGSQTWREEE